MYSGLGLDIGEMRLELEYIVMLFKTILHLEEGGNHVFILGTLVGSLFGADVFLDFTDKIDHVYQCQINLPLPFFIQLIIHVLVQKRVRCIGVNLFFVNKFDQVMEELFQFWIHCSRDRSPRVQLLFKWNVLGIGYPLREGVVYHISSILGVCQI